MRRKAAAGHDPSLERGQLMAADARGDGTRPTDRRDEKRRHRDEIEDGRWGKDSPGDSHFRCKCIYQPPGGPSTSFSELINSFHPGLGDGGSPQEFRYKSPYFIRLSASILTHVPFAYWTVAQGGSVRTTFK